MNKVTNKYGINFPSNEIKFGKTIDFLDVTLYLDQDNKIHYKGYSKPTDVKHFLNPQSFHPQHVFKSVPASQMIRTLNRNSNEETRNTELYKLKKDFIKSGYKGDTLERIETETRRKRANALTETATDQTQKENTLTFPVSYFDGLNEFKKLVHDLSEDFKAIYW